MCGVASRSRLISSNSFLPPSLAMHFSGAPHARVPLFNQVTRSHVVFSTTKPPTFAELQETRKVTWALYTCEALLHVNICQRKTTISSQTQRTYCFEAIVAIGVFFASAGKGLFRLYTLLCELTGALGLLLLRLLDLYGLDWKHTSWLKIDGKNR